MVVSLLHCIIQLEDITSLKEKRKIVQSLRQKMRNRFYVSAAEVDLNESLTFTELGVAYVSNSRQKGERVMQKVSLFLENETPGRIYDIQTHVEEYDS